MYLNSVPTAYCLHQNCKGAIEETNRNLRRALRSGRAGSRVHRPSSETAACNIAKHREQQLEASASASLSTILGAYQWPLASIKEQSPHDLSGTRPENAWQNVVSLFQPGDVIWIGTKRSSGPQFRENFRTRETWLECVFGNYQFICPAAFKSGSCHRTNENVAAQRFLVVESDVLDKNQVGAVFKWLSDCVEMNLRAVVDTAGKSLHGWFDFPPKQVLKELEIILPQLQCDHGMFTPSQPCRLPGMMRDDKMQSLIYLKP